MAEADSLERYLAQLAELGESELTFDSLSAREVLKALPALSFEHAIAEAPQAQRSPVVGAITQESDLADPRDWRAVLRATGAERERTSEPRRKISDGVPSAPEATATAAQSVESTAPQAPGAAAPVPRYSLPDPDRDAGERGAKKGPAKVWPPGVAVQPGASDIFTAASKLDSLDAIAAAVAQCTACPLYSSAKNPVPGEGNPHAELVCVGEGPGASEDETGRPFVGAAGKLLTSILDAIKLRREDVYICNVVKHRPPGNRTPELGEVAACQPYLARQLELIRPKAILALGTSAAQTLLSTKLTIGKLRGAVHRYDGIPLIVTYHPAALLRNPGWKRPTWEDVQYVRRILDGARGS